MDMAAELTPGYEPFTEEARAIAIDHAKNRGLTVIEGSSNHLLIDIDSGAAHDQFDRMILFLGDKLSILSIEWWYSKSGKHKHYYITLGEHLSAVQRIALQAILGSDPKRELLAIIRSTKGVAEPSLLFQPAEVKIETQPVNVR